MIQDTFQAVDELLVVPGDLSEPVVGDSVELSVVVTTRDRAAILDETLQALSSQVWADGSWDVVIVDNGSTDSTPEVVASWVDRFPVAVRVLRVCERFNPSYARNAAVAATMARSVAFVDDDDLISAGWVAAMGVALRDHELVGSRFEYGELNNPELVRHRTFQTEALGTFAGAIVVSGGGMGCRRDLWLTVGGSNEEFRTGQDIDFALRVAHLGSVHPILVRDATYHVRLRETMRSSLDQGRRMGRASVQLHHVHGAGAERTGDGRTAWRRWRGLILRTKRVRDNNERLAWANDLGHELGLLEGRLTYRRWLR